MKKKEEEGVEFKAVAYLLNFFANNDLLPNMIIYLFP